MAVDRLVERHSEFLQAVPRQQVRISGCQKNGGIRRGGEGEDQHGLEQECGHL